MGVLDALDEYIKEIVYAKHPFVNEVMSFRYTYALGVTIAAYVDDILDEKEKEKLFSLYNSLNIADKEEDLHSEGRNPTKETFEMLAGSLSTIEQKYIFLLDVCKILEENEKSKNTGEKLINGLIKILRITPVQKEKLNGIKEIIFHGEKFLNIEKELMNELQNEDIVYKMIVYFFNEQIDDFINEVDYLLKQNNYYDDLQQLNNIEDDIGETLNELDKKKKELVFLNESLTESFEN